MDYEKTVSNEMILNYHLMHPGGESAPGDPNVAFCIDGVYHLHYILKHPWHGDESATRQRAGEFAKDSFSFIHITSTDMLHWKWKPTKLQPSFTGHGMFSGTGLLTKEGVPAAVYCGVCTPPNSFIAIAKDNNLSEWEKPYPLIVENGLVENEKSLLMDPDCFLIGDTYYAFSAKELLLCKSTNLKEWHLVGPLLKHSMPDVAIGEDLSCANFFPLGNKWVLLCISHTIGCRYYIGHWDSNAEQFVPESHGRMNWRRAGQSLLSPMYRDFFAPESLLTEDGRRVMWAWLATTHPLTDKLTIQSLPRELTIRKDGSLGVSPLRELTSLRYDPINFHDVKLSPDQNAKGNHALTHITDLPGDSLEISINIPRAEVERKRFGFQLFAGKDTDGLLILFKPEEESISLGETEVPFTVSQLPQGENLEINIFVDKYLVEIFINGVQAALTVFMDYKGGKELRGYTFGQSLANLDWFGAITIKQITIWKLKPTNQGFLSAMKNRNWQPETK